MRNKRRYFNALLLNLVVITFSQNSHADGTITLASALNDNSKDYIACRQEVFKSKDNATESEIDAYCKPKLGAKFCIQQGFFKQISTNIAAIQNNLVVEAPKIKSQVEQQCSTAQTTATTGTPSTQPVATAQAMYDSTGKPIEPVLNTGSCQPTDAACLQAAQNLYQQQRAQYQSNLAQWQQQQTAAAQAQQQQQNQNNQQSNQAAYGALNQSIGLVGKAIQAGSSSDNGGNGNSGSYRTVTRETTVTNKDGSTSTVTTTERVPTNSNNVPAGSGDVTGGGGVAGAGGAPGQTAPDISSSLKSMDDASAGVKKITNDPGVVDNLRENADGNTCEVADWYDAPLQPSVQPPPPFTKFMTDYSTFKADWAEFGKEKETCAKDASRTESLCLEGKSPGIKAAKALVDYSGPILAAIGSAQKACSSTKDVLNYAALGMTVAKGVCVAAKIKCDSSCGKSVETLKKLQTTAGKLEADRTADYATKKAECTTQCTGDTSGSCLSTCNAEVEKLNTAAMTTAKNIQAAIKKESPLEPKTTPGMVKSCQDKGKDIALMVMDIGGLLMAKMSAQKCEQQLSSTGGAGGTAAAVSTKAYCEDAANKGTQFCKCQGTAMGSAECSGASTAALTAAASDGGLGVNLKGGPGMNGFAGGTNGGPKASGNFNIQSGNGGTASDAAQAALRGGANFSDPSAKAGGLDSGGAAGGGSSAALGPDGKPLPGNEDKKWNFSGFGGLSGGGSSGGGSRSGGGNGDNLTSQQKEYVERKIASERFRSEVSTASGADNWSKIKTQYLNNASSFMQAP